MLVLKLSGFGVFCEIYVRLNGRCLTEFSTIVNLQTLHTSNNSDLQMAIV